MQDVEDEVKNKNKTTKQKRSKQTSNKMPN